VAEDQVFGAFCREIGVANIRDYEARQLKLAQEESEARLRFETQIARLTHLYDMQIFSPVDYWSDHPWRCQFEDEQLKKLRERLKILVETVTKEEENIKSFEDKKAETQEQLERMQEGVEELEAEMSRIKATLDQKTKEVEEAKRAASKAAKALEQAEKEISLRVRAISRSTSARGRLLVWW
jgi:structural maintenance of chromosome 1